ncbi:polygalacturonase inhibitor 3-like [Asparagus officinalis]|uniref:polygalacturonase inhibitor 3-like n=1 Tax=Asparagus officinalis TaxID=4686 RepID=UPI00098E0B48|nr:polygalacturonase inhibitor 3-like [Asparagus officinalis]
MSELMFARDLVALDLSRNRIRGGIPRQITKATGLMKLDLSHNRLCGRIPTGGKMRRFHSPSYLHNKCLCGTPLPRCHALREDSDGRQDEALSRNHLSGPIPRELGRINFDTVDLSRNLLTGDASFLFGTDKWAREIDLSSNELNFDMSELMFARDLVALDLSRNRIRGGIPRQITKATGLMKLDLSHNRLCGRIPTGGKMRRFHSPSYLHNKCLCGTPLPRCH